MNRARNWPPKYRRTSISSSRKPARAAGHGVQCGCSKPASDATSASPRRRASASLSSSTRAARPAPKTTERWGERYSHTTPAGNFSKRPRSFFCHPEGGSATEGSTLIQARFFAALCFAQNDASAVRLLLVLLYSRKLTRSFAASFGDIGLQQRFLDLGRNWQHRTIGQAHH